jgi:hypothetical protein
MNPSSDSPDLAALLDQYIRALDTLRQKLLSGKSWEELIDPRRSVTELAAAIHKKDPGLNLLHLSELPLRQKDGMGSPEAAVE